MPPKRVLLLFLNTGGGHRSAALAVSEALQELYADQVDVSLVDVTAECFPWPLRELDAIYNRLVGWNGWPWASIYHLTDSPRRLSPLRDGWCLLTGRPIRRLLRNYAADVIVCCHPLLNAPLREALRMKRCEIPLITLVTDLASAHAAWFYPPAEICLVATEQAQKRAVACGLPIDAVRLTGLPVRRCFIRAAEEDRGLARRKLGLDPGVPVVLLLSGADGMGPFYTLFQALVTTQLRAQLVAITGRNERLAARLTSQRWPRPVHIRGFVENIHEWMRAADVLVTKAGPTTITEALTVGIPMVLSGAVPGQEPPNVPYVTERGAGVWAPDPIQAAETVRELLSPKDGKLRWMTQRAREAGCPDAGEHVAEVIWRSIQR